MGLSSLFKAKVLTVVLGGLVIAGGATAVFAATPAGQQALHAFTSSKEATETPGTGDHQQGTPSATCPGQPDAERLATAFSLSTASDSDALQAICALHTGTFQGTPPGGSTVSSNHAFGYGEIDLLLTYAQYLATHDQNNASGKLTTGNARSYLDEALHNCGTTPLEPCLKANIPGFQPGNGNDNGNSGNSGNSGNGNGNGGGKPDGTPTPPGKPDSTPTPHH